MIRLFDDPFFTPFDSVFERTSSLYKPKSNVLKTDDGYKLLVSVPGLEKDDLKITIKDGNLKISYENENKGNDFEFVEKFTKTYTLPDHVSESKIKAEVKNGILQINIPIDEKKLVEKLIPIE